MSMISQAIRNRPLTVIAATGVVLSSVYRRHKENQRLLEDSKKKKVLVLPFYRMKIVEQKSPFSLAALDSSSGSSSSSGDKTIVMPIDELVTLIHEAAQDPSIVTLYGEFGNGRSVSTGGWAHLQEIRNAIQVFATSHRVHMEPGIETPPPREKKTLYAYSNTFANPMGSTQSMQDYYLASAFSQIHLQPQGDLNLFGLHATNTFFRDFLLKNGITVHVWKHGAYKNMANIFTQSQYTREHYDNVAGVLLPIHQHVCDAIYTSRHQQLKKYSDFAKFWTMVENAGSLPARIAQQIGFVDHLPKLNPLDALVKFNQKKDSNDKPSNKTQINGKTEGGRSEENRDGDVTGKDEKSDPESKLSVDAAPLFQEDSLEAKWKFETDLDSFSADSKISIEAYAQQRSLQRQKEAKQWQIYRSLQEMSESNPVAKGVLTVIGFGAPYFNIPKDKFSNEKAGGVKEKIAVLKISGTIGEAAARKAEKAIRKIKEQDDIKCVVLRVDSPGGSINACETIYQELQDLPQKVVVSFGNVSASGGYYISANAARIFALPTTITGSIGVIMLRMDFRSLAKQYGITFDSIPTSSLSGSFDPFFPINQQMNENFVNSADRAYYRFKSLVSDGRDMSMKTVESLAKGRVYTGEQAQEFGLVDELGGLDRAIAYAQRNFTASGHAQVVQWPPKKSLLDYVMGGDHDDDLDDLELPNAVHWAVDKLACRSSHTWIDSLLGFRSVATSNADDVASKVSSDSCLPFPLVNCGIMLTADENTAIRFLLQETNLPQANLLSKTPSSFWE
ncbi:signal peptide peptidase SppA, 67K type [Nitzschia inconspicua]|uniref:Signal peptide peptidase SppA, 67K type n=1 Tax=Nitzschia inconspicua TaxID=303405 RepID=A0A9K3PTZ3_9STRA|nr:signal peptide peptidase SppA, 67K type [Nitzschia inconspicua]